MLDQLVIGWRKKLAVAATFGFTFQGHFQGQINKKNWVKFKIKQKFMIPFTTFNNLSIFSNYMLPVTFV